MAGFFIFLWRIRLFLMFVALEVLCGYLLVSRNPYQSGLWFNTSNEMVANALQTSNAVRDYFNLETINKSLAEENARLNRELALLRQQQERVYLDTLQPHPTPGRRDTSAAHKNDPPQYNFIGAKVINNSISRQQNYITINRGSADGIAPGMGVIAPDGVVGLISHVSEHFAVITSVLHTNNSTGAEIKRNHAFGSLKWDGADPTRVQMEYVAYNVALKKGDTVQTSSLSLVYPPDVMIGTIEKIGDGTSGSFQDITVQLRTRFNSLTYVYVVQNLRRNEQEALEQKIPPAKP